MIKGKLGRFNVELDSGVFSCDSNDIAGMMNTRAKSLDRPVFMDDPEGWLWDMVAAQMGAIITEPREKDSLLPSPDQVVF